VIVDYLQLVSGSRSDNRVQEVSEISRSLKGLARELDAPVLALSQLNRAIENRLDKRPQLSDLRESGAIEQDADIVMFIHREALTTTRDEWAKKHPTENYPEHTAELRIAKHRNGEIGNVKLIFFARNTQFANFGRDDG
jgi:replicative DNA helicase